MNRHVYFLVMLVTAVAPAENAELRGRIVDAGQAPLPNALVRLIPKGERFAVFRSVADRNGGFSLGGIPEGTYSMRIGLQGFKERAIPGRRQTASRPSLERCRSGLMEWGQAPRSASKRIATITHMSLSLTRSGRRLQRSDSGM